MSLFENFWFIQTVGAIALVFMSLAWNATTRKNILALQSTSLVFFIVHYSLLAAYAGASMCAVVLGRNFILLQKDDKPWARHWAWFYLFLCIAVLVTAVFWNGWITLLPVTGVIIGMYGMWKENPAEIRVYMLVATLTWIPYVIVVHSYSGLLSQTIGAASILVGMYRHDRKKVLPS